jgi:hypothetical protein
MTKQLVLGFALVVLFGTPRTLRCQNESKEVAQVEIETTHAIPQVYVVLRLRTLDQQVFVPYCGEVEGGEKILCTAGAHLQVQTGQGWRPAKLRTRYGVLGAESLGRAEGSLIAPRSETSFGFEFSRLFFEVEPGQRLRVVIDAWPDMESMKAGRRSFQLTSPPFECPPTDTGQ